MSRIQVSFYIAFTDYEKAFDSVATSAVIKAICDMKSTILTLLCSKISMTDERKHIASSTDQQVPYKERCQKRGQISPQLFTACLEGVFRKLNWVNTGIQIHGEYFTNLRFADDIVLFSETSKKLQHMFWQLYSESVVAKLKINTEK